MVITCDVTSATASTDTTEVTLGTVTLPANAKRILAVGLSACGGAGLTTLEGTSGIMRVSCNSIDVAPAKFPIPGVQVVTSGAVMSEPKMYPVDWQPASNCQVTFYFTCDMATTVANTYRGVVIFEK